MTGPPCAAPNCDNPVPRRPGPGRPAIYCTPTCRPSHNPRPDGPITINIDPQPAAPGSAGWTLTLRRGQRTVTIANNLGRFAAILLHNDIQQLLNPRRQEETPTP